MNTDSFHLEQAQQIHAECGKRQGKTFAVAVAFLALSLLVVYSDLLGDKITLPILSLKLDRWSAALVLLIASVVSIYRWSIIAFYTRILRMKIYALLEETESYSGQSIWYLDYPSVSSFFLQCHKLSLPISIIGQLTWTVFMTAILFLPGLMIYEIGKATHYSTLWWFASILSIIFIIAIFVMQQSLPKWEDRQAVIKTLDKKVGPLKNQKN